MKYRRQLCEHLGVNDLGGGNGRWKGRRGDAEGTVNRLTWRRVYVADMQHVLGQIREELRTQVVKVKISLFCQKNKKGVIFRFIRSIWY